jgi:hypothetical protein
MNRSGPRLPHEVGKKPDRTGLSNTIRCVRSARLQLWVVLSGVGVDVEVVVVEVGGSLPLA